MKPRAFVSLSPRTLFVLFVTSAMLAYLPHFIHFNSILGMDWDYFYVQSLVSRSAIWSYGNLPIHNPWVRGGLDLLANPQTRILSPLFLLDVLFPPALANVFALMVHTVLGLWGMFRLLRSLGVTTTSAAVASIFFVNGSYFALHFAEGHIPYGSMQLMPWVCHFTLRLRSSRGFAGLLFVLALMMLDGGIAAFGYSLVLSLSVVLSLPDRWSPTLQRLYSKHTFKFYWLAFAAFALFVASKYVPMYAVSLERGGGFSPVRMPISDVLRALFCPVQHSLINLTAVKLRFHEIGCYVGLVTFGLIGWSLSQSSSTREKAGRWAALSFIWFWAAFYWPGSEWFWSLFAAVPFFKHLHITTRVSVVAFVFYTVALAYALDYFSNRKRFTIAILALLVCESLFVRLYPLSVAYTRTAHDRLRSSTLTQSRLMETVPNAWHPDHYFTERGTASTYETASPATNVKDSSHADYKGEDYFISGLGEYQITSVVPGRITIAYDALTTLNLEFNTNWLGGWKVLEPEAKAFKSDKGLLRVSLPIGYSKTATLVYRPAYLAWVMTFWALGFLLWSRWLYVRRGRALLLKARVKPRKLSSSRRKSKAA